MPEKRHLRNAEDAENGMKAVTQGGKGRNTAASADRKDKGRAGKDGKQADTGKPKSPAARNADIPQHVVQR